jgi:hypothetical protein
MRSTLRYKKPPKENQRGELTVWKTPPPSYNNPTKSDLKALPSPQYPNPTQHPHQTPIRERNHLSSTHTHIPTFVLNLRKLIRGDLRPYFYLNHILPLFWDLTRNLPRFLFSRFISHTCVIPITLSSYPFSPLFFLFGDWKAMTIDRSPSFFSRKPCAHLPRFYLFPLQVLFPW